MYKYKTKQMKQSPIKSTGTIAFVACHSLDENGDLVCVCECKWQIDYFTKLYKCFSKIAREESKQEQQQQVFRGVGGVARYNHIRGAYECSSKIQARTNRIQLKR